jgi:hypothetical protein
MQRDMDVIRRVLFAVEAAPAGARLQNDAITGALAGVDPAVAIEHVRLLADGGFLDAKVVGIVGRPVPQVIVSGLTWAGHEFVNTIRNDAVWQQTKQTLGGKGLDLTFELVKSVAGSIATSMARAALGLPPA